MLEMVKKVAAGFVSKDNHTGTLRKKLIGSSVWVFFGYGLSQLFRLGGNLILTRLLFPEAFGLMAMINIIIQGVYAFSNVGLRASVVHNQRGDEGIFLNTAWTIQIIRGVFLWGIASLFALPAASFYAMPQLAYMIPVTTLVIVIEGFSSTSLFTLVRQISLRKIIIRDIGSQLIGLLVMVVFAYIWKSVWALVAGVLVRQAFLMIWSHSLIPDYRNRFAFDRKAAKDIFKFGKWIFVSTALTFIGGRADRLVLGKLFDSSSLGVYSVAFFLSQAIVLSCRQLANYVLFPVYTQLARSGIKDIKKKIIKIKSVLLLLTLPPTCVMAIFGQQVIDILYDARYSEAGWMLRILAARSIAQIVIVISERVLIANGDSFRHMVLQLSRVILIGAGIYIGYLYAGIMGLLIGMSVATFLEYFVLGLLSHKYNCWTAKVDMMAFVISGLVIYLGNSFV